MNVSEDIKRGQDALLYFHNAAAKYPENYRLSFLELQNLMTAKSSAFLEGFGFAASQISDSRVRDGMEALANQGQGKIPIAWNSFFQALTNASRTFSFSEAANETLKGTARDIASGVAEVGDVAIDTLKNAGGLVTMLPLLAFIALAGYAYMKVKHA